MKTGGARFGIGEDRWRPVGIGTDRLGSAEIGCFFGAGRPLVLSVLATTCFSGAGRRLFSWRSRLLVFSAVDGHLFSGCWRLLVFSVSAGVLAQQLQPMFLMRSIDRWSNIGAGRHLFFRRWRDGG